MSAQANAPVIIKRVKKCGDEAPHGGAWKVAMCSIPSVVRRRSCAGLEVRPLGAGSEPF